MLLQIVICSLKHIVILSRYIEFIRKYTGAWPKSWTCVLSLQLWDCIPYDSQLMFTFNPAFVLSLEKQDNLAPAIRVGDSDGIPGSCGHSVSLSQRCGQWPWVSACHLVDMVFSLPAHELRHSFQICVWKVTSVMTEGSRGTDIPSGQLHCHFWAGVERLGRGWGDRAFGRFLPALPLLNLYELGIYVE